MRNTNEENPISGQPRDHPHIHGEYLLGGNKMFDIIGSPPHTWGIPGVLPYATVARRITPTYMGNTRRTSHLLTTTKDHPHIHGEYRISRLSGQMTTGSPPHTWGIP